MFKASKRKRPVVQRTTRDESDDDDNDQGTAAAIAIATQQAEAAKRKKKKKRKTALAATSGTGSSTLSFNIDEGDDVKIKKSKKRGKGLGFGGMDVHVQPMDYNNDDEHENVADYEIQTDVAAPSGINTSKSASGYSKDELAKLKSQQKVYLAEKEEKSQSHQETASASVAPTKAPLPPLPTKPISKPTIKEADYISFNSSSSHPIIANGDDALKYTGEDMDIDIQFDGTSRNCINKDDIGTHVLSNLDDEKSSQAQQDILEGKNDQDQDDNDEEGRKWEDEVARRAGVGAQTKTGPVTSNHDHDHDRDPPTPFQKQVGMQAVGKIKQTIQTTLENLRQQDLDLESNIVRRKHDAHVAQEDATKKEEELSTIGSSFEYYQNLRSDVADWIGALRHLSDKIDTIERALEELYQDLGAKRNEKMKACEDDMISTLEEHGLLDYVVGRQPATSNTQKNGDALSMVDEFGRDVSSMKTLARSKKRVERRKRRAESNDRRRHDGEHSAMNEKSYLEYEDTDADVSDNEMMDRGERRGALGDAVQVVLDEMDDDFTSLASLLSLFRKWDETQPEDYKQCYAHLALVDLISVFARAEFCKKLDLLCLEEVKEGASLEDFEWLAAFKESNLLQSNSETGADAGKVKKLPLDLLIEKICFGKFRSFFKGSDKHKHDDSTWSFDPFSKRQSQSLSSFYKSLVSNLSSPAEKNAICAFVHDYINSFLQDMAVPIVKREIAIPTKSDIETDDAYKFATLGQLHRLKKLVLNIVAFWYPTLGEPLDMAKFCLVDIIAYRFLPILEALDSSTKDAIQAKAIFASVWDAIERVGWMGNDDLMLSSSPIRAAAAKLGY